MTDSTKAYGEGYDACWNGADRDDNPYDTGTTQHLDWRDGYSDAGDSRCGMDAVEDDGGWTSEDEESMSRRRDLPLRNEAGEYMCG